MSRVLCIIVAYGSDFTLTRVHYPIGNGSVLGCQGENMARGMALRCNCKSQRSARVRQKGVPTGTRLLPVNSSN